MSPIFENALDSLSVGMNFYMSGDKTSTRKHAILTIFHSIELMLKESLYRVHPNLIYKYIDRKITDQSMTVGFGDIIVRLKNLDVGLHEEQISIVKSLQQRRNRIEHHRYDHEEEDRDLLSKSLRFVLYFMEFQLKELPEKHLHSTTLDDIRSLVSDLGEREALAQHRIEKWWKEKWPDWDSSKSDIPDGACGTEYCPLCRNEFLITQSENESYCFWCCSGIEVEACEICSQPKLIDVPCCEEYREIYSHSET